MIGMAAKRTSSGWRGKRRFVFVLLLALVSVALWRWTPWPGAWELSHRSRPEALRALPARGANRTLNELVYWMHRAHLEGHDVTNVIHLGIGWSGTDGRHRVLVEASLQRNYDIATRLGLLTPDNLGRLSRGRSAVVTLGPYQGELAEVDHIVPYSLAPEVGNEIANLELLPASLNRRKSDRIGQRQVAYADDFRGAGLITPATHERIRNAAAGRR